MKFTKAIIFALVAAFAFTGVAVAEDLQPGKVLESFSDPVLPETTTTIVLSSMDVNRITCPGVIKDVVYSGEKGFDVKYSGTNAFIKFKVTIDPMKSVDEGQETYATKPVEMFVVCNDDIYTLIAQPKKVPSQTIRLLGNSSEAIEKNLSRFEGMAFEKMILQVVKEVFTGSAPDSYLVEKVDKKVEIDLQLDVVLKRTHTIEGEGIVIKEFVVRHVHSREFEKVELSEEDFLNEKITTKAVAVAIEKQSLLPAESTKVLVVEKKEEN